MPKLIHYADRFEGIREAVHVITLRDGVGAISFPTVAEELYLSARTLQRLVRSADDLPMLGLQWAEKLEQRRLLDRRRRTDPRPPDERALEALLDVLTGQPGQEGPRAWWMLVTAFEATADWALEARQRRDTSLTILCEQAVSRVRGDDRRYEGRRLHCLVVGAVQQILRGDMTYDESVALVTRHVAGLGHRAADRASDADPSTAA